MRILLVGPGNNFRFGGRFFYSFVRRLANGFIRNGHFVLHFSDRDMADYALGMRAAGRWLANRQLLATAKEVQPDLLVLHHAHLIAPETVAAIRKAVAHVRVVNIFCDGLRAKKASERFTAMNAVSDIGFVTTGGADLAAHAGPIPVAFIPNPVDASIDDVRAFEETQKQHDVFFACGKDGGRRRWQLADAVRDACPDLAFAYYGKGKTNRIWGKRYYEALRATKLGLNFNEWDGGLYASDRMAQYLGNGLLLATARATGYGDHFADDEMLFFDEAADLVDQLSAVLPDEARWRAMARKGYERAYATMGEQRVCGFIVKLALGESVPADWPFAAHIHAAGAGASVMAGQDVSTGRGSREHAARVIP
ncbi:MAG: glycosyltransferase [Pseudomonadota bacterium]